MTNRYYEPEKNSEINNERKHNIVAATMTAKEAAKYLGISYWSLLELCRQGIIPCIHLGKKVVLRQSRIDEWMMQQEESSLNAASEDTGNNYISKH